VLAWHRIGLGIAGALVSHPADLIPIRLSVNTKRTDSRNEEIDGKDFVK
jgi:hypothetical protein